MSLLPGPVGLWTSAFDLLPVNEGRELAASLDETGWAALWLPEAYGREAFTNALLWLEATERLAVGTGIANIWARDAMAAAGAARTLSEVHPGRFVLGLGVSHAPLVERLRGHDYAKPLAAMKAFLAAMDAAPYSAPPASMPTRVLAALGPKMVELAGEATQGVHPYLVTPDGTRQIREWLGPDKLVAVEQAVVLSEDSEVWRARAHWHLEIYTGLPNYRNSWLRQGFAEEDFVRGGSDRLKDAMVVKGDEAAVKARVQEHLDAGADHVCLQVLGDDVTAVPREDWARLAPALL